MIRLLRELDNIKEELKGDISAAELPILYIGNNKSKANRTSRYIPY